MKSYINISDFEDFDDDFLEKHKQKIEILLKKANENIAEYIVEIFNIINSEINNYEND
jgi:oligoendopeptidase F